jgi:hypothetical protein
MRSCVTILVAWLIPQLAWADPVVTRDGTSAEGALKTTITVTVRGLTDYLKSNNIQNPKFVLYLQGTGFSNLAVSVPTPGHDALQFYLDRVDANRSEWAALLRNPAPVREMPLTVGIDKGAVFSSEVEQFQLKIYTPKVLYLGAVLFLVLLLLFGWIAKTSDVLREAGPPPPSPSVGAPVPRKAYSLARVQMAVWFFVVAASFMLIWMITWALDSISPTILGLIGISAGTGLAAVIVDSGKLNSMRAQRDQLLAEDSGLAATLAALAARPQPLAPDDVQKQQAALNRRADIAAQVDELKKQIDTPAHDHFILDILSDANGISFNRFQMAVWTLILVIVFVVSVWKDLLMPDFNSTLLGLMGLSSGTYIGFKLPEVKN